MGQRLKLYDSLSRLAAINPQSPAGTVVNIAILIVIELDNDGDIALAFGAVSSAISYRGSTKYADLETGVLYYGYRYLKDGHWLSRDPLGERGGLNLTSFVGNDPVSHLDALGLTNDPGDFGGPVLPPGYDYNPTPPTPPITGDPYNNPDDFYQNWQSGSLPEEMEFGPDSRMTQEMRDTVGVEQARLRLLRRMRGLCSQGASTRAVLTVTYRRSWGLADHLRAHHTTEHYVGSYNVTVRIDAQAGTDHTVSGLANWHLVNTMGRYSFIHLPDIHGPGPQHNVTQHFRWTENISVGCCISDAPAHPGL